jgi:hypothetical protein
MMTHIITVYSLFCYTSMLSTTPFRSYLDSYKLLLYHWHTHSMCQDMINVIFHGQGRFMAITGIKILISCKTGWLKE